MIKKCKFKSNFTDEEMKKLMLNFAYSRKDTSFTKEELFKIVNWAEKTVIEYGILLNVLDLNLWVDLDKDDNLTFKPSSKGKDKIKNLKKDMRRQNENTKD